MRRFIQAPPLPISKPQATSFNPLGALHTPSFNGFAPEPATHAPNGFAPKGPQNGFMDKMMSPMALMGLSMIANSGPSLTPKTGFEGVPQALVMANQHKRQQQGYDMRAGALEKAEVEKAEKKAALNKTAQYYAKKYGDDPEMVTSIFNAGHGNAYLENRKAAKPSQREQQIDRLVSTGMDRQRAIGVVDGRFKLSTNPVNGERGLVDMATGEMSPINSIGYDAPTPMMDAYPEQSQNLSLYEQADEATGLLPTLGRGVANTLGQTGADIFQAPEQTRALASFNQFKRDMIRALVINPRAPVFEQKRIEEMLPIGPMTSPETLKINIEEMDRELARIEEASARTMQDRNMSVEARAKATDKYHAVQSARQRIQIARGGQRANGLDVGQSKTLPNGVRITRER